MRTTLIGKSLSLGGLAPRMFHTYRGFAPRGTYHYQCYALKGKASTVRQPDKDTPTRGCHTLGACLLMLRIDDTSYWLYITMDDTHYRQWWCVQGYYQWCRYILSMRLIGQDCVCTVQYLKSFFFKAQALRVIPFTIYIIYHLTRESNSYRG